MRFGRRAIPGARYAPPPVVALLLLVALAVPAPVAAQGTEPLLKTDLVRLLTTGALTQAEVAGLVRRNCLAFQPTERDLQDLRRLGADDEIMKAVDDCRNRGSNPARTPPTTAERPEAGAYEVVPGQSRITLQAGSQARLAVAVRRGGELQSGTPVLLRGSSRIPGGPPTDLRATTDQAGIAIFQLPATGAGTYALSLQVATGRTTGQQRVVVIVRPGPPAAAEVLPQSVSLSAAAGRRVPVRVAVRDSFDNPVPGAPVQLRPGTRDLGLSAVTDTTGEGGEASFDLDLSGVTRTGRMDVYVGGHRLGALAIAAGAPAASQTRFLSGAGQTGSAGDRLPQPLVLAVRDSAGVPVAGQAVGITGENARVDPTTAVTDSAGQVSIRVRLGDRVGPARVTAVTAGVSTSAAFTVAARSAREIALYRNGVRMEGEVTLESAGSVALVVRVLDANGNPVPLTGLRATAENPGKVRILADTAGAEGSLATTLRLTPVKAGRTQLDLAASGIEGQFPVDLRLPGSGVWGLAVRPGLVGFTYDYVDRPDVTGQSGWGVEFEASRDINPYVGLSVNLLVGSLGAQTEDQTTGVVTSRATSLLDTHAAVEGTPIRSDRVWPVITVGFGRYHIQTDAYGAGLKHTGIYWMVGGGLDVAVSPNVVWELRVATHQLIDTGIEKQAKKIGYLLPVTTGVRWNF